MTEHWIYKKARITRGSKYAAMWLNVSEYDVNMPKYVGIYDDRQDFWI